jgi:hypothetical protein
LMEKLYQERIMKTCAILAIKYGHNLKEFGYPYTPQQINEHWQYKDMPVPIQHKFKVISPKDLIAFMKKHVVINHPIWNSDFLHGLLLNGNIRNLSNMFCSFHWRNNPNLDDIIMSCPFHGKINNAVGKHDILDLNKLWKNVPAISTKYFNETSSYVAGILSAGIIYKVKDFNFIKYRYGVKEEFKRLGIPIKIGPGGTVLISPFWPALYSPLMPNIIKDKWSKVKHPYKAHEYAAIMWRTYSDKEFKRNAIPYLRSRRSIFYDYKCPEGAMNKLESLRFEHDLIEITPTVNEMIKYWVEKKY